MPVSITHDITGVVIGVDIASLCAGGVNWDGAVYLRYLLQLLQWLLVLSSSFSPRMVS